MLVKELERIWPNELLAQSPLWNRDIEKLTPLDLQVFLRTHWGTPHYQNARREIDALLDESWGAAMRAEVAVPRIVYFMPPEARITLDELRLWLMRVSLARRRALLFGLEMKLPLQSVVNLTWAELRRMRELTQFARALINATARHIRLDYVFWEAMANGAVAPLIGLAESALEASNGLGYSVLMRLYHDAIPVDQEAEMEAFIDSVCACVSEQSSN